MTSASVGSAKGVAATNERVSESQCCSAQHPSASIMSLNFLHVFTKVVVLVQMRALTWLQGRACWCEWSRRTCDSQGKLGGRSGDDSFGKYRIYSQVFLASTDLQRSSSRARLRCAHYPLVHTSTSFGRLSGRIPSRMIPPCHLSSAVVDAAMKQGCCFYTRKGPDLWRKYTAAGWAIQ